MTDTPSSYESSKRERAMAYALDYLSSSSGYDAADGQLAADIADKFYDTLYTTRPPRPAPKPAEPAYGSGKTEMWNPTVITITDPGGGKGEFVGVTKPKVDDGFDKFYSSLAKGLRFFLTPGAAYDRYLVWTKDNAVSPLTKSGFLDRWDNTRGDVV